MWVDGFVDLLEELELVAEVFFALQQALDELVLEDELAALKRLNESLRPYGRLFLRRQALAWALWASAVPGRAEEVTRMANVE